jgi:hypothetical protein
MKVELLERIRAIPGVAIGEGAFAPGDAVWVGRREVAHFDADDALDVRLTKAVIHARRDELRANPQVSLRPGTSDWIEVRVATPDDLELAVLLVGQAVLANLPTAKPGLPPTGAELQRRRRFH